MNSLTAALLLLLLALVGVVVRKTYFALPLHELKRRASRREQPAVQLYRAAAYGASLRSLLWLYIGLTSAAAFVLLARSLPVWASLLLVALLLWIVFSLLPSTRTTRFGTWLTMLVTPPLTWLLNYLHPALNRSVDTVRKRYTNAAHTGIFERQDLLELLKRQRNQADNRLTGEELDIIARVLKFNDKTVGDIMTPSSRIKTVLADDTVGPILIDELHQSGQQFALVRLSKRGELVGTLAFSRLNLDSQGKVGDSMDPRLYYLHEDDGLGQALHAFFATNQPLFVVVSTAGDNVGVLTIAGVLKELLGHVPGEEFDQYADLAAVAARHAVKTDDKVVE
jgi:CBS domain containing-hemolysin-like protein